MLSRVRALVAVAVILTGGAAIAAETSPSLEANIRSLISTAALGGKSGVYVLDVASGEVVANVDGEQALTPASCNKLLTTAAGLSLLGPQYRFSTQLRYNGEIDGGALKGDLIVRGGGDPTISGRFEANKKDVVAAMRAWADELTSRGIKRVTGNIVADDRFFDRDVFHKTWYARERGEWYEAEVTGLAFNDNCVDLTWSGIGKLPGDTAGLVINPGTTYARVKNNVRVVAKGRPSSRYYVREKGSNDIVASGTITVETSKEDSASVDNGSLYFASVFRDVLTSAGIVVDGKPMLGDAKVPEGKLLVERRSPILADVVNTINRNSQNFYAECLCKTLGHEKEKLGSFAAGCAVVKAWLRSQKIFTTGHVMADGSGLSPDNRVSPRQLVEVIRCMDKSPNGSYWRDSFPIGGSRGTLKARFQQTPESRAAASRIMGKTGLIGGVRTMSGIIKDAGGRELYYSIMLNDFRGDGDDAVELIDKVAVTMATSKAKE